MASPLKDQSPLLAAAATETTSTKQQTNERLSDPVQSSWIDGSPAVLLQALAFGLIFGFLLQKGGVAKFDILIGQLLLENFVVVKVMLSAIIVGMVGVYILNRLQIVEMQVKETVLGANLLGGLMFGVGFALIAYCPGTDAAAVGQGNLDAIVGILGMVFGSYLFALASNRPSTGVSAMGKLGEVTLPQLFRLSPAVFIAIFAPLLILFLMALEYFTSS